MHKSNSALKYALKNRTHLRKYSIFGLFNLLYNKIYTICTLPGALMIRRPAYIRNAGHIKIGVNSMFGPGLIIDLFNSDSELILGDNVRMNHRVHIGVKSKITIGNNVLVGSNVTIIDHSHGIYQGEEQSSPEEPPVERKWEVKPIIINDNVWICDNVVITHGVEIGKGVVIGANSIVNRSVPENSVIVGAPAKIIKKWNKSLKKWENCK